MKSSDLVLSILGFILTLIIIAIFFILIYNYSINVANKACQEIGFDKYVNLGKVDTCQDINGNLHYVVDNSEGWTFKFKEVSVGGVRIAK
jgi:hypothetical protein